MSHLQPELQAHSDGQPVAPEFNIGRPGVTQELVVDGVRYLEWLPTGNEHDLAPIAGWDSLPHEVDANGVARLIVPEGTRSASSVLSGKEAWRGEKHGVLDFITRYVQLTRQGFDSIDYGISLDSVGVTKEDDRRVFVSPPHDLARVVDTEESTEEWVLQLVHDLHQILVGDPRREELVETFFRQLSRASKGVGDE